ncbi:DUF2441 domain-containing protein [Bacteroides acidifaciens]|nr:DUF2441 domain-containing protein [Bacteroides acidifaciens]
MLGELITVTQAPHFFHIHTYSEEKEKWEVGKIYSTGTRNRVFKNPPKRFREEGFEKIRKESFKEFPSRYSCLFLSDNLPTAKYWAEKLQTRTGNVQCVEIELLSGKYVYVDESIYDMDRLKNCEIQKDANDYWNGYEMEVNPVITILFEGDFKICDEIPV